MGSFVAFSLPPFAIGFVALCFWWRGWLLLPVGAAIAIFGAIQYRDVMRADGPGLVLGIILVVFLLIGAGSGFVASALVVAGRMFRWRMLRPVIVLPTVFALGFASYFAFTFASQKVREARYSAPAPACLDTLHDARLGSTTVAIPISPGILVYGPDKFNEHYVLWSNPDAKAFCSITDDDIPTVSEIAFMLDGYPSRRDLEIKHPFCKRKHSEYPWADMACNLIPTTSMPDLPVEMNVYAVDSASDQIGKARTEMEKYPAATRADGLKVHVSKYDLYLERPDGQFARCHPGGSQSQPWLYCMAKERIAGNLMLSYNFRATEATFLQKSATVAAHAVAIFNSIKQ